MEGHSICSMAEVCWYGASSWIRGEVVTERWKTYSGRRKRVGAR